MAVATSTALIISTAASIAAAAAGTAASISASQSAAKTQAAAASRQAQLQYTEITRQQKQVNETAIEQKSDRIRKASQELGTLRVMAGETGASGDTFMATAQEIGYFEGLDLSRIENNRKSNIEAGEAAKKAAQAGAINTVNIAQNQANAATTSAVLSFVGSGLQIGAGYSLNQSKLDAMEKGQRVS